MACLDRAADWNAQDLGEIVTVADGFKTPLGYTAARAFCDLDRKDPEPYRPVVRAIGLAEQADELVEVNLLFRAVPIYEQVLLVCSDAYCIQARLAV